MSVILKGGASSNLAEVTSNKELKVVLPQSDSFTGASRNPGYVAMLCESDPGSVTASYYAKSPEVGTDYRMRVGLDTVLFNDTFNYVGQWFAAYDYRTSTLTTTWAAGGFALMNAANNTAAGATAFGTYRYFPVFGSAPLYFESVIALTNVPPVNFIFDVGLFIHATTSPMAGTDGVYFRVTSAGVVGIYNYNGVEVSTPVFMTALAIGINQNRRFTITADQKKTEFWIDDVLYAQIYSPGNAQPFMSGSLPASWRLYQSAVATPACQVRVGTCTVSLADFDTSKDWAAQMAGMGYMGQQAAPGQTAGITPQFANNANPAGFTPTNTTTPAGSVGLGGIVVPNIGGVSLAVTTDYVVNSYLNPATTTAISGRQLYIHGIDVHTVNMGATNAAVIMTYLVFLFFGSSTITLATASDAAALKMVRRIPLGVQSIVANAVAGTPATPAIVTTFKSPIVVNPAEYVGIGIRFINGTLTTGSQAFWMYIKFDAYWE
jgi:hypothetical protein